MGTRLINSLIEHLEKPESVYFPLCIETWKGKRIRDQI